MGLICATSQEVKQQELLAPNLEAGRIGCWIFLPKGFAKGVCQRGLPKGFAKGVCQKGRRVLKIWGCKDP